MIIGYAYYVCMRHPPDTDAMPMITDRLLPAGWYQKLQDLDIEGAYDVLCRSDQFYSFAVRGYLRHTQVRFDEALELFDEAEARYLNAGEADPQAYVRLLGFRLGTRVLIEAERGTPEDCACTDGVLEALLAFASSNVECSRIRDKCLGMYHLVRGSHSEALDVFERAIAESSKVPDRCIPSYICAAAAAHELGLHKQSRRHYENAELTMAFYNDRFIFATFLTWLLALCRHWGWHGEVARWVETINVLQCPEPTRESLFRRARALQRTSKLGEPVVFA